MTRTVKVELPSSLCRLASAPPVVELVVAGAITQRSILNALEASYPALLGTLRDHKTQLRRPFIRFFVCQEDLSHLAPDDLLPEAVGRGMEPFLIVGAIAGG